MSAAATSSVAHPANQLIRLFLCGDVMIGRGIDQILLHPCNPALHERWTRSAIEYVRLAEEANGPIPRHADPSYVWGEALDELKRTQPDARIINLETSITLSELYVPKGINYRVSPDNTDCLKVAQIDCCVLANNHILDWQHAGLLETLATLKRFGIKAVGAGRDLDQAAAPAVLDIAGKGRVLVFSFSSETSGTHRNWAATQNTAGVNFLRDFSDASVARISEKLAHVRRPNDVVVVSIHWGSNWGYEIPDEQRDFAHMLIDRAGVSVIHGHSSHHAKSIEVYRDRLILYGCGDFLNDYEGIKGYEEYRDDLALMYFADVDPASGNLVALEMVPLQIRQFRLIHPSQDDIAWLQMTLDRGSQRFGTRIELMPSSRFTLSW